jgi:hypothetical protein
MSFNWTGFLLDVAKIGVAAFEHSQFISFLKLDRQVAMTHLGTVVDSMTAAQFDRFESDFLQHCVGVIDINQRLRAFELYAWVKFLETRRHGEFRGFVTAGEPLP